MRPIDADALVNTMCFRCKDGDGEGACAEVCRFANVVSKIPTLDYAPKWISVKDRLPEKLNENNQVYLTEEVIGFDGESAYIGQFKVYKYDGHRTFFDGDCFRSDITHWMPIPEAPKEG